MTAAPTGTPMRLLKQVCGERQTGALMVGGQPGGAVYVVGGQVILAESPAAPGVGDLLVASGRLAGRTWQNALDLGSSTARVGRLLVEQGHLTQGELELCVLGASYDAAYFTLTAAGAPLEFLPGATHWLGAVVAIDPAAIGKEVRRRVLLLDEIFADGRVDNAAVRPVARPPRERVTLTALQWELLINADGQRTPADLALLLGKAGFATIQELRRLAAQGLIELPEVRRDAPEIVRLPRARGTAVDVHRPAAPVVPAARTPVAGGRAAVPHQVTGGRGGVAPAAEEPSANGTVYRPPRLARRKPGAKLPKEVAGDPPPEDHPGTDEDLLHRIRSALRALQ